MSGSALSLYIDACRHALGADLRDPSSWAGGLEGCLVRLRHALTCCVCGGLLRGPMGHAESVCGHFVCTACVGGKTRFIKRGCGWCKEHSEFIPNTQLSAVVACFSNLCTYLHSFLSPAAMAITNPSNTTPPSLCPAELIIRQTVNPNLTATSAANINGSETTIDNSKVASIDAKPNSSGVSESDRRRSMKRLKRSRRSDRTSDLTSRTDPYHAEKSPGPTRKSSNVCRSPEHERRNVEMSTPPLLVAHDLHFDAEESAEADETVYDAGSEAEEKLGYGDNIVLSEHDYNRNALDASAADDGSLQPTDAGSGINSTKHKRSARNGSSRPTIKIEPESPPSSSRRAKPVTIRQMVEAKHLDDISSNRNDTPSAASANHITSPAAMARRPRKSKGSSRSGCRCAMAAQSPGKLTCCGQRCPCYSAFRGCVVGDCRCRGCRNPRGDDAWRAVLATSATKTGASPAGGLAALGMVTRPYAIMSNSVGRVTLT